jgi:hypothetical protein
MRESILGAKCVHCGGQLSLSTFCGDPILLHDDGIIHCHGFMGTTRAEIRPVDIPRLLGGLVQLEVELR